jgi:Domain of unknown function DUF29
MCYHRMEDGSSLEPMMATRIKPAPKELYEEDFYVWAQRQAELLRARQYDELDLEHLIEEVEDLGGAVKKSGIPADLRLLSTILPGCRDPGGRHL